MQYEPEFSADLSGFEGQVPLFPLEGLVLFPHVAIPLHIFEPRYRRMTADALETHRLIAMAVPRTDRGDSGQTPLHEVVCIGRITAEERLAGGRYNLILTGLQRARIERELVNDLPYRIGELTLLPDSYNPTTARDRSERQRELLTAFKRLSGPATSDTLFQQLLDAQLPLGVLCDLLAAALKMPAAAKYRALSEVDVDQRGRFLLETILSLTTPGESAPPRPPFPPRFSLN
jgi:Lon protease-like protein